MPSSFMDIISFQSSQRCCEEGGEETEAQRGEVTGLRAHSKPLAEPRIEQQFPDFWSRTARAGLSKAIKQNLSFPFLHPHSKFPLVFCRSFMSDLGWVTSAPTTQTSRLESGQVSQDWVLSLSVVDLKWESVFNPK